MNGGPAHARPHADGQGATGPYLRGAALRDALVAFLSTRPLVLLVGYVAVLTIGLGPRPGFVLSRDPLANLPARFDAGWYCGIALSGYDRDFNFERQRNTAARIQGMDFWQAVFAAQPVADLVVGDDRRAGPLRNRAGANCCCPRSRRSSSWACCRSTRRSGNEPRNGPSTASVPLRSTAGPWPSACSSKT